MKSQQEKKSAVERQTESKQSRQRASKRSEVERRQTESKEGR